MENLGKEHSAPEQSPHLKKKVPQLPVWLKLLLVFIVVLVASIGYLRNPQHGEIGLELQGSSEIPDPKLRKQLPPFSFTDQTGKIFNLGQFKGKVVLLSFWASWCTPCLIEMPTFSDLHNRFEKEGLVIVPVNVDEQSPETDSLISDFWRTKKFPFPTYFDRDKSATAAANIENLPTNFLIDRNGLVVAQGTGANDWSTEQASQFIGQLLLEQSAKQ